MTIRYFNVKQGIQTGNVILDATSGNVSGITNANLGNIVIANFFSGSGNLLSNIQAANINGTVANANYAAYAGNVVGASQSNITSLGTLTGLISGGTVDFTTSSNVTLGPVANIHISGGTSGYVLSTNGSGALTWSNPGSTGTAGSNTQIQFNDGGSFGASANLTFSKTTNTLTTTNVVATDVNSGTITATTSITGNLATNAQPNITSVGTLTSLAVSGNVSAGNVSGTLLTGTLATASQPNITSTGTLGNLTVTNSVAAGSFKSDTYQYANGTAIDFQTAAGNSTEVQFKSSSGDDLAASNAFTFNSTSNTVTVSGNVNATSLGGTLTTAIQTAITSIGTLGNLAVTSNANVGQLNAGNANVTGTLITLALTTDDITAASGDITINSQGTNSNVVLAPTGTGFVTVSGKRIHNVATPVEDTDAANKSYVDGVAQGLDVKASVVVATEVALPASTYSNGTSGVGATLTANAVGALTVDDVAVALNDRILVKNQATAFQNGIYKVTTLGTASVEFVLTRTTDFDQGSPSGEIPSGFTFVEQGTSYSDTGWVCTTNSPVTVGTTAINFTQFSGAGQYEAGAGLALAGTVFSVNVDNSTIEIDGDTLRLKAGAPLVTPNIGAATGTSLIATGNIQAGNLISNADVTTVTLTASGNISASNANLGNIVIANFFSGNGSLLTSLTASAINGQVANALVAGTVYTASQPNITSVGTLTSLAVTGNLSSGNASLGNLASASYFSGNGSLLSAIAGANVTGQVANALVAGTVYTAAQPNVTSVGTLTSLTVSGNTTTGGLLTNNLYYANGAAWDFQEPAGANGYVQYNNNGSFGGAAGFTFDSGTNTLTVTNISGNGSALTSITGSAVTGQVANALVSGTVYTAAQPNITSVGTLTSLDVTGNLSSGNASLGNLASASYFSGNGSLLSAIAGANVTGIVANATYATNAGSASTADSATTSGTVTTAAQPNITSVGTLGSLSVTGTITAGNVYANAGTIGASLLTGTLTTAAQPNVTSVGTLTSLNVTGNVTSNNVGVLKGIYSTRTNINISSNTLIDSFSPATVRTAKYIISAAGDHGYQSAEAMVVHDGTNSFISIYGIVCSNSSADLVDFSSNINSGTANVSLYATTVSANTVVNVVATYIDTDVLS